MADPAANLSPKNTRGAGRRLPWRALAWGSAVTLLLLPLVAMQFTGEVNWSLGDFVLFALMLVVTGGGFELAMRARYRSAYRAASALALVAAFLLVWVNAAVGFVGDGDQPINLTYLVMLAFGLVCGGLARFRPRGLSWVLLAMAAAQAAIMTWAWLFRVADGLGPSALATCLFVAMWLLSAALFWRAGR